MSEESKENHSDQALPSSTSASSCLRSGSDSTRKNHTFKVSFPEDESHLITGYLEPANPWEYAENVSRDDLIATYKASCEKHGTRPLPMVLQQLQQSVVCHQTVDIEAVRSDCLDLRGEPLAAPTCECLEEVLKRVQFKNINLESTALDDEGSVALFDMMEYYESATHLNISCNKDIGVRGWQACSRMIKKTRCLEQLDARSVTLNEQHMPILSRALRIGTQLQVLKLENSGLSGRPIIILAAALKLNTGLRELYLADNGLNVTDAAQLGALLRSNLTLQLLDVSNNNIQDVGVGHILDGLVDQTPQSGGGLCILVVWNNHLTRNASRHLSRALARSRTLEILNVGHNVLTNESLHAMKNSLLQNRTLLRIGMQSTHLTCEGAVALAECIADNTVIQRIDLRDNNVQLAGLMALTLSMKVNRSVSQLDLDDVPKKKLESAEALKQYRKLVQEIRGYCARNEQEAVAEEEDVVEESETTPERRVRLSSATSRKISLTCETLMRAVSAPQDLEQPHLLAEPRRTGGRLRSPAPSPVPSPVSSPIPSPSRNRFQVSRVTETSPSPSPSPSSSLSPSPSRFFASPGMSRFRVTLVEPSANRPPAPKPIVSSPSGNNITVGFSFKLNDKEVTINTSIAESCSVVSSSNSVISNNASLHGPKLPGESVAANRSNDLQTLPKEGNPSQVDSSKPPLPVQPITVCEAMDTPEDTADLEVRQLMDRPDCTSMWDQPSQFSAPQPQPCSTEFSAVSPPQQCLMAYSVTSIQSHSSALSEPQLQPSLTASSAIPLESCSMVSSVTPSHPSSMVFSATPSHPSSTAFSTTPLQPSSTTLSSTPLQPSSTAFSATPLQQSSTTFSAIPLQPSSTTFSATPLQSSSTTFSATPLQSSSTVFSATPPQPGLTAFSATPRQPSLTPFSEPQPQPSLIPCSAAQPQSSLLPFSALRPQPCSATLGGSSQDALAPLLVTDARKLESKPSGTSQRTRKISWVAPVEPHSCNQRPASSLEKLLGLFQHPSSFFNKTQPQYKATTVIVNQQPVANSNASFLLTAGPLAGAAKEARAQRDEDERLSSPDEEPEPDVLNNNSRDSQGAAGGTLKSCSRCTSEEREQVRTRHGEDENFNLSQSCVKEVTDDADKRLWCAGVCGASVVKSWTQSSSSSVASSANSKCVSQESDSKIGFRISQEPLLKENVKDSSSASRLYVSMMKSSTPANGMSVSLLPGSSSSGLWPDSSQETRLPVTSVRLVGGGNAGPSIEQNVSSAASTRRARELLDAGLYTQSAEKAAEDAVNKVGAPADP